MKNLKLLALPAAASMFAMASPASAATLLFDLTANPLFGSPQTAVFELDSNPTPDRINDQSLFGIEQIFFNNVSGVFNGVNTTANIGFGRGGVAKIQVLGRAGAPNRINASANGFGPLFTGTLQNPMFSTGTFTSNRASLTVSEVAVAGAVPEPATWAMLIFGFAVTGFAMRRRKTKVSVSYA